MPIPFKKLTDDESPNTVGYLKFLPRAVGNVWLGALFIMDALGEPVEFTYARIRAPKKLLWRPADLNDHCVRSMCVSMFDACPVSPILILCLANEVGSDVFKKDISVSLPVGRLSESGTPQEAAIDWAVPLEADHPAKHLFDALAARGLLMEPFERAEIGLCEVYPDVSR